MSAGSSESETQDVVRRLRTLADWVETEGDPLPELRIFGDAASEIERLRARLDRITAVAGGSALASLLTDAEPA